MSKNLLRGRAGFIVMGGLLGSLASVWTFSGCRGHQYAHVLSGQHKDLVGSHEAGAETFNSLVDESVGKLLARQSNNNLDPTTGEIALKRICFVGVENRSSEDIGDFKDQLFESIDSSISSSGSFKTISPRFVDTGLRQLRMAPEDLMVPSNRAAFQDVMQQFEQPFDYLLFAKLTSGTTESNQSYQRDYHLTLELVDINDGSSEQESAKIRKGYHPNRMSKWTKYSVFK